MLGSDTSASPRTNSSFIVGLERTAQTVRVGGGVHTFPPSDRKPPHCPIKRRAQWYILPAAAAIRGAGNSTILWASTASQLIAEFTAAAAAIVQREEVLICKHGGVILIPGRQDAISGPRRRWLQSSPALQVAVPALLLVRLHHVGRAADVVGQR